MKIVRCVLHRRYQQIVLAGSRGSAPAVVSRAPLWKGWRSTGHCETWRTKLLRWQRILHGHSVSQKNFVPAGTNLQIDSPLTPRAAQDDNLGDGENCRSLTSFGMTKAKKDDKPKKVLSRRRQCRTQRYLSQSSNSIPRSVFSSRYLTITGV